MNEKTKNILTLFVTIVISIIFGYFAIQQRARINLLFFWSDSYYYLIFFILVIAFILLFARLSKKYNLNEDFIRIFYGLVFLPATLFPMFRCYFKVPYVFCRACPSRCPWGELRPLIIPSFLVLNLDKRFWCFKLCPFGAIQDLQCKVSKIRTKIPLWLRNIRYIILLLVIYAVLSLIFNENSYFGLFKGTYHFSLIAIIAALSIFILAFFIPRFWCNYFCPIGSFSDLVLKLESKFKIK